MTDKEATVYIVDVGRSMGKKHHGREESDLTWASRYFWDKITTAVGTGRKTINLAVIGLGTDDTKNELGADEGYQNISVFQPMAQILMPQLRNLEELLRTSKTYEGDAISAIILAISMISAHCKQNKWIKKVVLITNATGHIDAENNDDIIKKIRSDGIELVVLGVDFDDTEYGYKEEDKPHIKAQNEAMLRNLTEQCGGIFGTMKEAIDELSVPRIKNVKPVVSYKGQLRLGDPKNFDTALCIDVERFPRTMIKRPPTASAFVLRADGGSADTSGQPSNQNNLTVVRSSYAYQVNDENSENGKRDVMRDDLAKGYEYGRTAVHINESDLNITKLETDAAYEILGFILASNVERYMILDNSNIVIAQRTNDKAIIALSSLIRALFELESCAIARLVKKDMSDPLLTLLSPSVEKDYECLIENQLPFAEDFRTYRFPPLDKILTVSGKSLTQHRNLPKEDLVSAMSDFVDSLDLSAIEGEEYATMEETFSPVLHRIEGAVKDRAVQPQNPVPPIPDILVKYSKPPQLAQTDIALEKLISTADVKKVPPTVKGRKRYRETEKPLSGLDVEDLFRNEKRVKISPDNAIPEFKQMLAASEDLEVVRDAVKQMSVIIEDQIRHSFGGNAYERAIEGLGVMKQELTELEEPGLYNDMLRALKDKMLKEQLGGNRRDMWELIRRHRMSLIDKRVSHVSDVTPEDADAFLPFR